LTAEPNLSAGAARRDAGFTLPEVLIVVVLMGVLMPVLAMTFSVVARTSPTSEARADDSRSLTNLTNWVSQDVSSTSEDGFFIGTSAPDGGCLPSSLPASSFNLLELHWREGTKRFVSNYRWESTTETKGQIFRYSCLHGQAARQNRMTPPLNKVSASPSTPMAPAPVRITPVPSLRADGTPGIKGLQFVVVIFDDKGVQRELLNLDATTTNIAMLLPGTTGGLTGTNTAPTASDLTITMARGTTRIESLPALDPNGDVLFTTFPGPEPLPPTWNVRATGTTIEITPDPLAAEGAYPITYRVTDPAGEFASARLVVTIVEASGNLPPVAQAASLTATRSQESTVRLTYSDPEGDPLQAVLVAGDIPAGWLATIVGNEFRVTPSPGASGSYIVRYTVTDSVGQTATAQITIDLCTVSLRAVTPASQTVPIKANGRLAEPVSVEITTNGACSPLVLGFLPNNSTVVEVAESFNASNVVTIAENAPYSWTRPPRGTTRIVPLNVRQGANGPALLTINLTTTR
jgi:prepilin-type N-terminal cleavage/methylation domain-containing protein